MNKEPFFRECIFFILILGLPDFLFAQKYKDFYDGNPIGTVKPVYYKNVRIYSYLEKTDIIKEWYELLFQDGYDIIGISEFESSFQSPEECRSFAAQLGANIVIAQCVFSRVVE